MKGLLVKDFQLLFSQMKFMMVVLIGCVFLLGLMDDTSFLVGYITFICGIVATSTLSYDEYDNGNTFLFTLPITRKEYVREKFALSFLICGIAWIVLTIGSIVSSMAKVDGYMVGNGIREAIIIFAICMMLVSIIIPFQLKFSGEKSKVILLAIGGVIMVVGYSLVYILYHLPENIRMQVENILGNILDVISSISIGKSGLTILMVCIGAVVMLSSMYLSQRILEKKDL